MTQPMSDAVAAQIAVQEQFEAAVGVAKWAPVPGFPGVEASDLGTQWAARAAGTTAPTLGFSHADWQNILDGDPDLGSILGQLSAPIA